MACKGQNCGGYTLEAALGVSANSRSEPDFLGWEVKQHAVAKFDNPHPGPVTLFTPEPTGGVYVEDGVEAFIRRYGYADTQGRANRMNFGGVHKCGTMHVTTTLTLVCTGFDIANGVITDFKGGVELIDQKDEVAARWAFVDLLEHWKRKHGAAAFVPAMVKKNGVTHYRYGSLVTLGEGTDFILLLKSFATGRVYYDPGIKLEAADSTRPRVKRRSQFRTKFGDLRSLYHRFEELDVCEASI